jgi:hypothetical protein
MQEPTSVINKLKSETKIVKKKEYLTVIFTLVHSLNVRMVNKFQSEDEI